MPGREPASRSARLALAALAATWLLAAPVPVAVWAVDECAQADRLLDGGSLVDLQRAEAAYREILVATPDSACANTGDQVATDLITAVELHRAGLNNSVSTHIVAALKLRPQTRLPAELRDDGAVHRAPWQTETWLAWQDRVVLALGGFLVLVLVWPFASWGWRRLRYGRRGGRLLIGSFSGADGVSGDGFAAVVGDHVQRLGDFRSGQRPDRVSKWGDPVTVPAELVSAVPPVGLLSAVLGLVGRAGQGSDRCLSGTLHASGPSVVGVSLTLETRQSRVIDGCGVWSSSYAVPASDAVLPRNGSTDRPEMLYPLAFPVAVWAFWKLTPDAWRLGTSQWQSYALFGMGEDYDANGQVEQAERCYLRALACDPENLPARLNLASMWLMSSTGSVTGEADAVLGGHDEASWAERELRRIQRAAATARERPGGGSEPDSFWYRAQYVLAASAARRHLEEWGSGPPPVRLGAAGEAAVELSTEL
ncbi:MAG TPA: tetratricopeptide repeat protein, partial [Candidatus Dormibacteraeota bacterium]